MKKFFGDGYYLTFVSARRKKSGYDDKKNHVDLVSVDFILYFFWCRDFVRNAVTGKFSGLLIYILFQISSFCSKYGPVPTFFSSSCNEKTFRLKGWEDSEVEWPS